MKVCLPPKAQMQVGGFFKIAKVSTGVLRGFDSLAIARIHVLLFSVFAAESLAQVGGFLKVNNLFFHIKIYSNMYAVYEGFLKVEVERLLNGYRYRVLDGGAIVASAGGIDTAAKAEISGRKAACIYAKSTTRSRITRIKN